MRKVAVVTDTNAGILSSDESNGLFVIAMPILINGEEFFEGENLTHEKFYQEQNNDSEITTSQPSLETLRNTWSKILDTYEQIVYIPMSSSLSSSCQNATMLAEEFGGKVIVVDNTRISCSLKIAVQEAVFMAGQGKTAQEISAYLMLTKAESSIYISIPTLKYLKKGGRLTSAAVLVGTMLSIKPVLQIQQGKLDSFAKCFTFNSCKVKMLQSLKKDMQTRFANKNVKIFVAYTYNLEEAQNFKAQAERFLGREVEIFDELPLSIATHIGQGSIACGCSLSLLD